LFGVAAKSHSNTLTKESAQHSPEKDTDKKVCIQRTFFRNPGSLAEYGLLNNGRQLLGPSVGAPDCGGAGGCVELDAPFGGYVLCVGGDGYAHCVGGGGYAPGAVPAGGGYAFGAVP